VKPAALFATHIFLVFVRPLRRLLLWIDRHDRGVTWIFRVLTLLSVAYLVSDRIYETGAAVSSPASDPKNPFHIPFSITNNSHLFALYNLQWTCHIVDGVFGNITVGDTLAGQSSEESKLSPGGTLNIPCDRAFVGLPPPKRLTMQIDLVYDTNILGYTLTRCPSAFFWWTAEATNPQWIKGDIAGRETFRPLQQPQWYESCKTLFEVPMRRR
jgi:hypothetical protein